MATYKHLAPGNVPRVLSDEEIEAKYAGLTFEELANCMYQLEASIERIQSTAAPLSAEYEIIRKRILPNVAEDSNIKNMTINFANGYTARVQMQPDMYVQVLQAEEAHHWLRDNGHGDLIKPSVHAGSLKAAMKRRIESGQGTPPDDLFKVTPFKYAMIVKA